ncbi:MAG: hypothetical protein DRQ88_01985 [Epsilonproteobacteria bacterium]|nr:MAG: hypothetical protein DRQ88_01985 [Campylobacterota bacterium]
MKIIFYGASPEIKELAKEVGCDDACCLSDVGKVKEAICNGPAILVLNIDANRNDALALNQRYSSNENIKTILVSENVEMEKEGIHATASFFGELDKEKLKSFITDNDISTDQTLEKDIQDAFNMALGEEETSVEAKEEIIEEPIVEEEKEEEPIPSESGKDSYNVVDTESDLTFDLGTDLIGGIEKEAEAAPEEKIEEEEIKTELELGDDNEVALELGEEEAGEEKIAMEASGDLDLGDDLGGELELGASEEAEAEVENIGDLDLDLGEDLSSQTEAEVENLDLEEDLSSQTEASSAPEPDIPIEFTVEIPKIEEELIAATETEVVDEEEKIEAKPVEAKEEEAPVVEEKIVGKQVVYQYDDNALVRLEATIRQLREEREEFLNEIQDLKADKDIIDSENLGFRSEVAELRIEVGILKKRNNEERGEYHQSKKILEESLIVSDHKMKNLEGDVTRLSQKARIDISKIRQKERELESQLELLTMDSENQINNRENKILDLKRKMDALEFNMENVGSREARIRDEKLKVEEKLNKVMKNMRSSIKFLEEELETEPAFLQEIKKEAA